MTKRIVTAAFGLALLAGPALAMGEGGCNWDRTAQMASAETAEPTILITPAPAEDAQG